MAASLKIIPLLVCLCLAQTLAPPHAWARKGNRLQAMQEQATLYPVRPPEGPAVDGGLPGVPAHPPEPAEAKAPPHGERTIEDLLKFVNLHPLHPERAAALFQAARLAREEGRTDLAVKVYTLAAALYPDTHTSTQAQVAALTLKFYQELAVGEPLAAFRRFLEEMALLSPPAGAPLLAEPLEEGWAAVAVLVRTRAPLPAPTLEEVLALWELHPQELRPPWAGLLIARLLRDAGMTAEASLLFSRICEQGPAWVRTEALVDLLELAWGARGLPGVLDALHQLPLEAPHLTPGLKLWLARFLTGEAGGETGGDPLESWPQEILGWMAPKSPQTGPPGLPMEILEGLLRHSWPQPLREWLMLEVARRHWQQQQLSQAAQVYLDVLALQPSPEVQAFCQDRLALSRLQGGHPDAAREIYQDLGRGPESLWQLWAQTRLMDLELARLKIDSTP